MKTSRATVEANREKLLAAASEGFRRKGFDGFKVADIMHEAGLTHGGFATYFASKDELAAAACDASLKRQAQRLRDRNESLDAYIDRYLSTKNRDQPGQACMFPSLAAEASRQSEPVRRVFTEGLKDYLDALDDLAEGEGIALLSTLVGAMVLARVSDDEALSDRILVEAAKALKRNNSIADQRSLHTNGYPQNQD